MIQVYRQLHIVTHNILQTIHSENLGSVIMVDYGSTVSLSHTCTGGLQQHSVTYIYTHTVVGYGSVVSHTHYCSTLSHTGELWQQCRTHRWFMEQCHTLVVYGAVSLSHTDW
ncbi:hypothetical protein FKM82_030163 [Ascaphus truei]